DHGEQISPRTLRIRSGDLEPGRSSERHAGGRRLKAEPEATEPSPQTAVEVYEAEMESRRHADGNALGPIRGRRRQMRGHVAWSGASPYHSAISEHRLHSVKRHHLTRAGSCKAGQCHGREGPSLLRSRGRGAPGAGAAALVSREGLDPAQVQDPQL